MASNNMNLGHFRLEGIPPAPRGVPQVEVTFDIDANGILNVTARDKATSREQKVTITASTNLNQNEIERMVRQAREHEAEDRKHRELIDARNTGDSLAYQTEKTLRELGDKAPENERQAIQSKIDALRQAIQGDDTQQIKRLSEELQNAFHALSQQLYAQQSAGPQPGENGNGHGYSQGPSNGSRPDDEGEEVIEGEFSQA
jgi:molecular chaperone DnaK